MKTEEILHHMIVTQFAIYKANLEKAKDIINIVAELDSASNVEIDEEYSNTMENIQEKIIEMATSSFLGSLLFAENYMEKNEPALHGVFTALKDSIKKSTGMDFEKDKENSGF